METAKEYGLQAFSLLLVVILWEWVSRTLGTTALPPPSSVAGEVIELFASQRVYGALWSTLLSTSLGFAVAFIGGIVYGIAAYAWPRVHDISTILFQAVLFAPTLILVFLALVMLGNDNRVAVVVVGGFVGFPFVGVYIRDALGDLDQDILNMAASFNVNPLQRIREIYLPYLAPPMLAAGRVGFSLVWKVTFLAEAFGFPEGLGWQVRSSYTTYDMGALLAWLVIFIGALLIIEQGTRMIERFTVEWS